VYIVLLPSKPFHCQVNYLIKLIEMSKVELIETSKVELIKLNRIKTNALNRIKTNLSQASLVAAIWPAWIESLEWSASRSRDSMPTCS